MSRSLPITRCKTTRESNKMKYPVIIILLTISGFTVFGQEVQDSVRLKEVLVQGNKYETTKMRSSLNLTHVNRSYIQENLSGSLMQTLDEIPGIKALSIGSGQSKPFIRGLGFNRMVVAENGIKHEGQQWGEEHGLEVDQFAVDEVEIIKGPASLKYGSDAIGGVINLKNNRLPIDPVEGEVHLFGRTNNESIGISAKLQGIQQRFYYRIGGTWIDYGDYQVPADSIQYYSYYFKLKDKRLRNTAGKERNGNLTLGWTGDNFRTAFTLNKVYSKSGFFANAHGLEIRLSDIDYDRSTRDIDLPYHNVNHFKIANISSWNWGKTRIEGRLAYQNNRRQEFSEAVSHGYMPIPPDSLERKFDKDTYSAAIEMQIQSSESHESTIGLSGEHQQNRRGGWGFIIPGFRMSTSGLFVADRYTVHPNLILNAGIRFDWTRLRTDAYRDWFKTPVENGDSTFQQRSKALSLRFNSLSWSAGINYRNGNWLLKANIGKSYRAPIAKELSADGINYHLFRYEKGNADLEAEESYQLDGGVNWSNAVMEIQLEPYLNYFPNYIYLNPTAYYQEGLQRYHYTQNKVFRYGFEMGFTYQLTKETTASIQGEYLYAEQLSGEKKGYGLPFSPPWSTAVSLRYRPQNTRLGKGFQASVDFHITGKQDRIIPPEETTKGYQVLNASVGREFALHGYPLRIHLQGQNLLNKRYYDHTSYYRLIDVPEPGRGFTLQVEMKF